MPFISEELWHEIKAREEDDCLIIAAWPTVEAIDSKVLENMAIALDVVGNIRNIKNTNRLPKHELVTLAIKTQNSQQYISFVPVIQRLAIVSEVLFITQKLENSQSFVINADEFFVPLTIEIDVEKEKENLIAEIAYTQGFLASVEVKLSNEKFINSAPAKVIEIEQKKKSDALAKLSTLEESLKNL